VSAIAIVPARLGSTRFPGKVLADSTGKPLIQHVCESAAKARSIGRVVVATDDRRVLDAVRRFGGEALMTSADHPNGTSRLAEACEELGLGGDQIIVNVQGDEPEIEARIIDAAVRALDGSDAPVSTCAVSFGRDEDPASPHMVKVVRAVDGRALYFSRSPIPHDRDGAGAAPVLRHIGVYAYRRSFLELYRTLGPTPLERAEQLEQLRALEHGHAVEVALVEGAGHWPGVDTPEQYEAFVRRERARRDAPGA